MVDNDIDQGEGILNQAWDRFTEFLRIFPILILLVISVYALNSTARTTIDQFLLSTPAKDLVTNQYSTYPAFLDQDDVIIKETEFNDSGVVTKGLIIEIHNPGAIAMTQTDSMKPMFGPGNLLIQEEVDSSTKLNLGDIIIYENSENKLVIHQIVSQNNGCYITKGLNNPAPDPICITHDMVKFRLLFAIPTK
jgi:hypothetical protein